jgi:hypothetical protein
MTQTVCDIEHFRANLKPVVLTKCELPRYGLTPIPIMRPHNAALALLVRRVAAAGKKFRRSQP